MKTGQGQPHAPSVGIFGLNGLIMKIGEKNYSLIGAKLVRIELSFKLKHKL